jgi:hypothetical protein
VTAAAAANDHSHLQRTRRNNDDTDCRVPNHGGHQSKVVEEALFRHHSGTHKKQHSPFALHDSVFTFGAIIDFYRAYSTYLELVDILMIPSLTHHNVFPWLRHSCGTGALESQWGDSQIRQ